MCSLLVRVLVVIVSLESVYVSAAETRLPDSFLTDKDDSLAADQALPYPPNHNLPPDLGIRSSTPCPKGCTCSKQSCGAEVDCSGLLLTEVPAGISPLTECLDLSMNNITNIDVESFRDLKQLKKLCLSGNFITDLPSDFFPGFRQMHTLFLQDNLIKTISANTVSKMPNLKNLNLGANYISEILPNAFARLESLDHLWLDDNLLTEIPARALSKATSIKALSLDMNQISQIRSDDFTQLKELNVVLLKHNRISEIEAGAFEGTTNLQILELSYNNLTSFPLPVKNIFKLKRLMLNENRIETLPGMAFAGNPDIEVLSLLGNPIRSVDRTSFTGLNHLKSLSLENINDQVEFPDFSDCSALQKLTISGGKISSLPLNLCNNLPSLEYLSVDRNRLRNLSGLQSCQHLTVLRASKNKVVKLRSSEMSNLNTLQELDLSGNDIDEIDQDAFSTMSLQRLNLGNNFFTYLPVRGIGSLRELNVTGVRTLLYLPPIELFHSLSSLVAFYPYHCCQLAKASRLSGKQWTTRVNQFESYGQHRSQISPIMAPLFPVSSTPAIQCTPDPGPLTPCDDLLPSTALRIFSWLFMVVTFILNSLILFSCGLRYSIQRRQRRRHGNLETGDVDGMLASGGNMIDPPYMSSPDAHIVNSDDSDLSKSHYFLNISRAGGTMSDDNDTFDITLCHLAFADVIVTIYTAVILSYDHSTLGEFAEHGAWWQQSAVCHSAGFLLTFGTQLGFCTIVIMAVERYLVAMHPLQPEKHLKKGLVLTLTLSSAWILSLVTATVTLFGGGGLESGETIREMLPAQNGAACLPWTTDFTYVAVLVSVHILFCVIVTLLSLLILCSSPKQTWLIPKKNTRRQVALAITFNVAFIVPLAIISLYVSGVMTFSKLEPGENGEYYSVGSMVTTIQSDDSGIAVLDMGRVLAFVMFIIPFRPFLNPILYIIFNKSLRRDLKYLGRKIFVGDTRERHISFPPDRTNVLETMYDGSVMASHQANNNFPSYPQTVFDSSLLQRTSYDSGGIATPSFFTPSIRTLHTVIAHSADRSSSNHISTLQGSERGKRRRRRSRSRRTERRPVPDSDLTTESEVITFHRANSAVYYNPESRERRRKKLSVRNGGVNAKDEFQRLIFPRHPLASSSSHGSDSTVYPILPANRTDLPSSNTMNVNGAVTKDTNSKSQSKLVSSKQTTHYDLSALQTLNIPEKNTLLSREINNNSGKSSSASIITGDVTSTTPLSNDVDLEVASITSSMIEPVYDVKDVECFEDKDLTKRTSLDSVRPKRYQRATSREEDYLLLAVRNSSRNEALKELDPNTGLPLSRKNSTASHSSASRLCDLTKRGEKVISGCDYCDSSASKDSGIHSEIDSTSGASYSDASIGRRLRFSTNGALTNLLPIQNTSRVNENDIARFELSAPLKTQDFQIVPATTTSSHIKNFSEILNTETAI